MGRVPTGSWVPGVKRFLPNSHHPSFSWDPCWSPSSIGMLCLTNPPPLGAGCPRPPRSGSTGKRGSIKGKVAGQNCHPGAELGRGWSGGSSPRESTEHYSPGITGSAPAGVSEMGIGNKEDPLTPQESGRSCSCKIQGGGVSASLPRLRRKNFSPWRPLSSLVALTQWEATGMSQVLQGCQISSVVPSQGQRMYCS